MRVSFIPILLFALPIIEIAGFIIVGQHIGVLPVLALIFLTAAAGSLLLRIQGLGVMKKLATEMDAGRLPARELIHGAMIIVAGLLLILPGFVTDLVGLLLFIPPIRDLAWTLIKDRISFSMFSRQKGNPRSGPKGEAGAGPVVDLDEEDYRRDPDPNSPWTRRLDR